MSVCSYAVPQPTLQLVNLIEMRSKFPFVTFYNKLVLYNRSVFSKRKKPNAHNKYYFNFSHVLCQKQKASQLNYLNTNVLTTYIHVNFVRFIYVKGLRTPLKTPQCLKVSKKTEQYSYSYHSLPLRLV